MDIEFTQNMEIEKLNDFLKNCCRVCLSVENEMVESTNIVENFNKTIDQLLFEYTSLKVIRKSLGTFLISHSGQFLCLYSDGK